MCIGYLLRHLSVPRESVTAPCFGGTRSGLHTAVVAGNYHKRPGTSALDHSSWFSHRLMACFSPFYGVRNNDRYADQRQPRQTMEQNKTTTTTYVPRRSKIKPTEQCRGRAHNIDWAICKHVGLQYVAMQPATAAVAVRCTSFRQLTHIKYQIFVTPLRECMMTPIVIRCIDFQAYIIINHLYQ